MGNTKKKAVNLNLDADVVEYWKMRKKANLSMLVNDLLLKAREEEELKDKLLEAEKKGHSGEKKGLRNLSSAEVPIA